MSKPLTLLRFALISSVLLIGPVSYAQLQLWPGDINNNGIVNGKDVLRWGYANGATGPDRPDNGSVWAGVDPAQPWSENFPGETNFSFGDCNGDGMIDIEDVRGPITKHFGNTHGTLQPDFCPIGEEGSAPALRLVADKASYGPGERIELAITLGDAAVPAVDFYGITFRLTYNRDLIRPGAVTYAPEINGWYDPTGASSYSFFDNQQNTGIIEIAVTRTNQVGVDGHGVLGRLSLILRGNIELVLPGALNIELDLVQMINSDMEIIPTYYDPDLTVIIADNGASGNCPTVIDPVCGSDGRTYINSCYAEAAGITLYTQGVCYSDCIDPAQMRPAAECETTETEPVCGCNNITYANPCLAEAAGVTAYTAGPCQSGQSGSDCYDPILVVQSSGTEVDEDTGVITVNCPDGGQAVCGCDGITYPNACAAEAAGITFYTIGTCGNECIDPASMDPDATCTNTYEPVCGCNGIVYTNACIAEAAGVVDYTPGNCGASSAWCDKAIPIQCGDFLAQETTVGAGNQLTVYPNCLSVNKPLMGPDRIYVFDKKTAGDLQIGLEILTPDLDLDLLLLSGTCEQAFCIASSTTNNKKSNNEGIVVEDAPPGTYYIVVDAQFADAAGRFRLELNCGYLDCSDAIELTCGQPFTYNNSNGNDDVSLYTCGPNNLNVENNGPEVVHYFTTTTAGEVDIQLTGLSANLELFLLRDCDRGACMQYSQNPGTASESLNVYLEPGTYYVVVDGYNGATSDYTLTVNCLNECDMTFSSVTATPSTCATNTGTIQIISSGGTPGYIVYYSGPVSGSFSTSSNSCTIYYLPAGIYRIRKIDAKGCRVEETVTINSTGSLTAEVQASDAVCSEPGQLSVALQGGQGPYRVFLSGPRDANLVFSQPNFTISNLGPGTYDLYILDAQGCSVSKKSTIQEAASDFAFSVTPFPARCGDLGYAQVVTQNGTGPYAIQLEGPVGGNAGAETNAFKITKLPGGTYKLTVRDSYGCTFTQSFTIGDINIDLSTTVNNGICGRNGEISVQVTNGTPEYKISWTGPVSGSITTDADTYTITDLPSGDYQIEIEDANNCTAFEPIEVNNTGEQLSSGLQAVDGACGADGALRITINNGSPPFRINWSGPQNGQQEISTRSYTLTGLSEGLYNVRISDQNNCQSEQAAYVNIEPALELSLTAINGKCSADGAIQVSLGGGQANYIISWNGPSSGSGVSTVPAYDISGLASGSYQVSVTDARGCTALAEVSVVNEERVLSMNTVAQSANCDLPGQISVSVSGGAGDYQISWEGPESGEATADENGQLTITDLPAGTYQLSAIDANGCTGATVVTVNANAGNVAIGLTAQDPICTRPGRINVSISNGNPNYSISWEGPVSGVSFTGSSNLAITELPPGDYKVTVADRFGCLATGNITLKPTGSLNVLAAAADAACGQGNIKLTMEAGTPSFDISWDGPVSGAIATSLTTYTIPELPDGTYTISVSDINGCTDEAEVQLFSGSRPKIIATPQTGSCGEPGAIEVSVSGGAPGFTLQWNGPADGSRTFNNNFITIPDLPSGNYNISLVDANGCSDQTSVELVNEISDLAVNTSLGANACGQQNSILVTLSGGAPDYLITWVGPQSDQLTTSETGLTLPDLPAGNYQIIATDAKGCSAQTDISVPDLPVDLLEINARPGICGQPGAIEALITGGTPGFTINWTGPVSGNITTVAASALIEDLPSGTYSIVLTDANGCSETELIELDNDQTDLTVDLSLTGNECGLDHNVLVSISGGAAPYALQWDGPETGAASTPANGYEIDNLNEGTYTILVTDQNGCTLTKTIEVIEQPLDILDLRAVAGDCGLPGRIELSMKGGEPTYELEWTGPQSGEAATDNASFILEALPPGDYLFTLTDINGCTVSESISLAATMPLVADVTTTDGTCSVAPFISVAISSGSPGYAISWSGPVSGDLTTTNANTEIEGLTAGTYELKITDARGCEQVESLILSGGASDLSFNANAENGLCGASGGIRLTISGGAPGYSIAWNGPVSGQTDTNLSELLIEELPAGDYALTISDQNGCRQSTQVEVAILPGIEADIAALPGECGELGAIRIDYDGAPPYSVSWSGPRTGSQESSEQLFEIPNLIGGTYEVVVTGPGGCSLTRSVEISNVPNDLDFTLSPQAGACEGPGTITVGISGGNPNYTIEWAGSKAEGKTTQTGNSFVIQNLPEGIYTVLVTDGNGCRRQKVVQLNQQENTITLSTSIIHPSCDEPGYITVRVNGSFPDFTLSWTGASSGSLTMGAGEFMIPDLAAGQYNITVKDAQGCSRTRTITLNDLAGTPTAFFNYQVENLTAYFQENSSNGQYLWDFGDGTSSTEPDPTYEFCDPGSYAVCLTITNNCGTDTYCTTVTVELPADAALLDVDEILASTGSQARVPVRVNQLDQIISLEGSLEIADPTVAQITGLSPGLISPLYVEQDQSFTFYQNDQQGIQLQPQDILFYIDLQVTGLPGASSVIRLSDQPKAIEVGGLNGSQAVIQPHFILKGSVTVVERATISGQVATYWGAPIPDVSIDLAGPETQRTATTNGTGAYELPNLDINRNYTLRAAKDSDPFNGLSTYSLFIGQRFILGLEPEQIASPYQIVAGDANCNGSFTTLDLFIIQQLIVGETDDFNDCPSWVFITEDSPMPLVFDAYNVFPYQDQYHLFLEGDNEANFVGVKVGDILGDANPAAVTGEPVIEVRNPPHLDLLVQERPVAAGEIIDLTVTSDVFRDIVSYQFGLEFDPSALEYLGFEAASHPELSATLTGKRLAERGLLSLSWFSTSGVGLSAEAQDTLFNLRFRALRAAASLQEVLGISDRPLRAEVHREGGDRFIPRLRWIGETTGAQVVRMPGFELHQNVPNPAGTRTSIDFDLPEALSGTLSIHDQFGRIVQRQSGDFAAGSNQMNIYLDQLAEGVYYYTLQAGPYTATRPMIVVK